MKASLAGAIAACVALGILVPPAAQAQTALSTPGAPAFAAQQLDQLVAPVALYPDELLGQILMAATYPLEVVEAWRWAQDPNNHSLTGDALAAALAQQDWDPSVKALVPFPPVLQMMNDRLDWMQRLGDAFLAQESEVMDAVQRLRRQAQSTGALASTPQQVVTTDGQTIIIEPVNPDMVYPPYYDPRTVYGPWPDPDYPPYHFPPPYGYVAGPPLFFGFGVAVIPSFWGWDHMDWHRRGVRIDVDRFNRVNRQENERWNRPPATQDSWQHDPSHRRGVAYRDPTARARFAAPVQGSGSPDARRSFRGFDNSGAAVGGVPASGRGTGQAGTVGRGSGTVQQQPAQERELQRRSSVGTTTQAPPSPAHQQQFQQRQTPTVATPPAPPPPVQTRLRTVPPPPSPPPVPQPAQTRMPVVVRPPPTPPPAFAVGRGHDVQTQSSRGLQSLQSEVPKTAPVVTAPARHPAPPAKPPAGGGGAGDAQGRNLPGAK